MPKFAFVVKLVIEFWFANILHLLHYVFQACEVVRPLIQLLGIDRTAIQNFEALMALTNLAAMSDTVRCVHEHLVTVVSCDIFLTVTKVQTNQNIRIEYLNWQWHTFQLHTLKYAAHKLSGHDLLKSSRRLALLSTNEKAIYIHLQCTCWMLYSGFHYVIMYTQHIDNWCFINEETYLLTYLAFVY